MYYLYGHGGSGDHASEDRIRGTCRLLRCRPEIVTGYLEEDWGYGLAALGDLTRRAAADKEDVCLLSAPANPAGRKVLWCAAGENLPPKWARRVEAVVVCHADSLQKLRLGGLKNKVRLGPDPCFLVDREIRPLEGAFHTDTVGLCLSAGMDRHEMRSGLLYSCYCDLIRFLLTQTPFELALIPYCCKAWRNDEILLRTLFDRFCHTGRVHLRKDGSSPVLRGDISLCRCVIGSAGAVAAWSCGVPALCIGADPGAVALSADLFGDWRDGVLPVAWIKEPRDLIRAVRCFMAREDALRTIMETTVPYRRQRSLTWNWETMALDA